MAKSARFAVLCIAGLVLMGSTACRGPHHQNLVLRQSQHRAMQLYQQSQQAQATAAQLAAEKGQLQQQLAAAQQDRQMLEQRLANMQNERQEMQQRYMNLVNSVKTNGSPLSPQATDALEELQQKYPDFEFDPQTGVSKFHSDILFESGSAEIRANASPLLQEFVQILNRGDSQRLNILVVGHTDDRPVGKPATRAKHYDNWELSAHRAVSVTRMLARYGLKENRMGVAGYGPHQPLVPNTDDKARQRNRRVEIFVLAPNAAVAGWDQGSKR